MRVYAVDPGDMRTDMHQRAFPGEDISDRPLPGDRRPGAAPPARGAPGERPVPRRLDLADAASSVLRSTARHRASAPPTRPRRRAAARRPAGRGSRTPRFADLGEFLDPGDLVVVNTSGTLSAAVDGDARGRPRGHRALRHRARRRRLGGRGASAPARRPARCGDLAPRRADRTAGRDRAAHRRAASGRAAPAVARRRRGRRRRASRTWPGSGRPIRYGYVRGRTRPSAYQTVFAREPGSAEMPSAGRPFTDRDRHRPGHPGDRRRRRSLLHTGVSSQDAGEPPQPERFRVPRARPRGWST